MVHKIAPGIGGKKVEIARTRPNLRQLGAKIVQVGAKRARGTANQGPGRLELRTTADYLGAMCQDVGLSGGILGPS
jgi:hypothetical protein